MGGAGRVNNVGGGSGPNTRKRESAGECFSYVLCYFERATLCIADDARVSVSAMCAGFERGLWFGGWVYVFQRSDGASPSVTFRRD